MVVTLPRPQGPTEAHFVAFALRDRTDLGRYFTLEHALSPPDDSRYTVLGEWTADRSHVNFGPGPEPDPVAFLTAIGRFLGAGPAQ